MLQQSSGEGLQSTVHHADGKALATACYGLASMQQRPDQHFWLPPSVPTSCLILHATALEGAPSIRFWDVVWQQIPRVVGSPPQQLQQQQQSDVAWEAPSIPSSQQQQQQR